MLLRHALLALALALSIVFTNTLPALAAPRVVLISLDGAKPELVELYQWTGALPRQRGLGRLERFGVRALQNVTVTPSVTAVAHIAIATGSTAVHNDIPANTFHPVAALISGSISGFAAPIGGYHLAPLGPSSAPTAEPLWVGLRAQEHSVVTATWPGSDGADIRINNTLVQAAVPTRTNDYTVPFGAFGGLGAQGYALTAAAFAPASPALVVQLASLGLTSFTPVQVSSAPIETVFCSPSGACGTNSAGGRTLQYDLHVAALDTDDEAPGYDTLAIYDARSALPPPPYALPSTGPAVVRLGGPSARFLFEGSGSRVGCAFYVSALEPDLSVVRLTRYGANFIPRNTPVLADVDDINENVGFWAPQPDFRIPERISPGFGPFSDEELEAIYEDQVASFTEYQTAIALRAIAQNPDADLVMIYFEQPDGSGHQFTLTDPRQATNPLDPTSVGLRGFPSGASGQDWKKRARYASYLRFAYQSADRAVERVIQAVGVDARGAPQSDIFVVSDHGMAPFHTAVSLRNLLANAGVDLSRIGFRTTGPAAHVYVNLAGREAEGTVAAGDYQALVDQVATVLREARDGSRFFNPFGRKLFSHVFARPSACGRPGFCTDDNIGQDSGDVLALMIEGYNFDGIQTPAGVARLGEPAFDVAKTVFSVPNFYGAHGHDSELRSMSAILYAAGPSLREGRTLPRIQNIDVAPTLLRVLGVSPAPTVDGAVIPHILRHD